MTCARQPVPMRLSPMWRARLGPLDVIVANAGIAHRTPLNELTESSGT